MKLNELLLNWYDQNARTLPWRGTNDVYRIWLSEIMLQQTQAATVRGYYARFLGRFPDVFALAAANEDDVLKLWEGLGYYSRARNLHAAAKRVAEAGGRFPDSVEGLQALPGIGPYAARAIASIAYNIPCCALDGNQMRVLARAFAVERVLGTPFDLEDIAMGALSRMRPGDYNQALMELGALVCLPGGAPLCSECPLRGLCAARALGVQETLPVKAPPAAKRTQHWTVALVLDMENRRVLLQQRPQKGLLAGLWQPVLLEGARSAIQTEQALAALGVTARAVEPLTPARHVFSHLVWEMDGFACAAQSCAPPPGCVWAARAEVDEVYTLPGAFKAYRPVLKKYL